MKYSDHYVAFLISDRMAKKMYDNDATCDEVWENCLEYQKDFEESEYDLDEKSLYDCVQDFLNETLDNAKHL